MSIHAVYMKQNMHNLDNVSIDFKVDKILCCGGREKGSIHILFHISSIDDNRV